MMQNRPKSSRKRAETSGRISETFAAIYLTFKGYQIIEWRKKSSLGEIDMIARRGKTLAFIEIKYRKTIEIAQFSVTKAQQQRIKNAANLYCSKRPWAREFLWRFDVIAIAPWKMPKHIKDAF